ncbi:MAG: 50S ribosomal protein L29 [Bacteroidia bacterium]|jgi:large subunit ribosomal protein L29
MKTVDIKALSDQELVSNLAELKSQLNSIKFNHSLSPLENPMIIRQRRRVVAQLLTELTARKNR